MKPPEEIMNKIIIGLSLLVFLFSVDVNAENTDFKISVPANWVEFPDEILVRYNQSLRESTGLNEAYQYGYQLNTVTNWFAYPYSLVQVKRSGRIPEEQLTQYKKFDSEILDGVKTDEDSIQEIVSYTSQGETLYESGNKILWSAFSMDVANAGRVKGIIAIKLTEYGFIQLTGYALEKDFSKYMPVYKEMAESIELKEGDKYRTGVTDNTPIIPGFNLKQAVTAAVIGLFIAGTFGLLLKLRSKNS